VAGRLSGHKLETSFKQLMHIQFLGAGTNGVVTAAQYLLLALALYFLWRRARFHAATLLALSLVSTGVYWVLKYSAMRAIYSAA
jgi:O-acetyl-ADP-ribose deacetylase (regulator of RNase III)